MFKLCALLSVTLMALGVQAAQEGGPKKILVAGSLSASEHKYYEQIAEALSTNEKTQNVVYLLTNAWEDRSTF